MMAASVETAGVTAPDAASKKLCMVFCIRGMFFQVPLLPVAMRLKTTRQGWREGLWESGLPNLGPAI